MAVSATVATGSDQDVTVASDAAAGYGKGVAGVLSIT